MRLVPIMMPQNLHGRLLFKIKAFSLLEIALSLSMITVIAMALLPLGGGVIEKMKIVRITNDLKAVAIACGQYYRSFGHWPSQVADLQPDFLSPSINSQVYVLDPQTNILIVSLDLLSVTVIRPQHNK